jgi:hypothetical protein
VGDGRPGGLRSHHGGARPLRRAGRRARQQDRERQRAAVRPDREDVVTDGPFAETKEVLGGYYLIECEDLDKALAIGKLVPVLKGSVEIRPVRVFD